MVHIAVELAKSGRSACKTCSEFIPENALRFGVKKHNGYYQTITWHHSDCFWQQHVKQMFYFRRKNINRVLMSRDFERATKLDAASKRELSSRIALANNQYATVLALTAAGIPIPTSRLHEAPETTPTKKTKQQKEVVTPPKKRHKRVVENVSSGEVQNQETLQEEEEDYVVGRTKRKRSLSVLTDNGIAEDSTQYNEQGEEIYCL
jgi:hypothetical protein